MWYCGVVSITRLVPACTACDKVRNQLQVIPARCPHFDVLPTEAELAPKTDIEQEQLIGMPDA